MEPHPKEFLSGNELIALAAARHGAHSAHSVPCPPATEILPSFRRFSPGGYGALAVNERVALELALAEAAAERHVLCAVNRAGLATAAEPLFQGALSGVSGALVVVSADDAAPLSSLSSGDSRLLALAAGIPVFDPSSPGDAHDLALRAFDLSARHGVPVLLRPAATVCQGRQDFLPPGEGSLLPPARFRRSPERWAPLTDRGEGRRERLLAVLAEAAREEWEGVPIPGAHRLAVVASGHPWAILSDVLVARPAAVDLVKADMPHPVDEAWARRLLSSYDRVLVVEEPSPLLELLLRERGRVEGRSTGAVPPTGRLSFDVLSAVLDRFVAGGAGDPVPSSPPILSPPARARLCPGCGHRAAFHAIRRVGRSAILPGDVGCVSLGVNTGTVDALLCTGSSIPFAEALHRSDPSKAAMATMGDAAFFHSGMTGLLNAVTSGTPIVACILDNGTAAMTGFQEPPHASGGAVTIEGVASALGARFVRAVDPYDVEAACDLLREALDFARERSAPAVVVLRRPCLVKTRGAGRRPPVSVNDACRNCGLCYRTFECPDLSMDGEAHRAAVDPALCTGCAVCVSVCPFSAIAPPPEEDGRG